MAEPYRLADEPKASPFAHVATNPIWPLFGHMFGGAWLAWPWYVLNAFAIGSPRRWRDLAVVVVGLTLTVLSLLALFYSVGEGHLPEGAVPYGLILIIGLKLGLSYALYSSQTTAFALHEYYGGRVFNGIVVVALAGFFLRKAVLGAAEGLPFLLFVIA